MAHNLPASEIKLYVWPKLWDIPSFDPYSLSAILYLQLAVPGKFSVVECTDPDLSPSGQLPFLVHGQELVASFSSIVKYVANLAKTEGSTYPSGDVDEFLSTAKRSQRNAWLAHVEANLGNLVASALYATQENWEGLTLPGLASLFPLPQRYFVPQKLREAYQPRLEGAGLWAHPPPDEEEKKKTPFEKELRKKPTIDKRKFLLVFQREKFVEKAKPILDIYSRLLAENTFLFGDQISSLDAALASRIILLLNPPYPEPTIKDLLTTSYPNLVAHAQHVQEQVLGSNAPSIKTESHRHSVWSLIPSGIFSRKSPIPRLTIEKTDEERHVDRMRWGFIGLVFGSLCAYIAVLGAINAPQIRQIQRRLAEDRRREAGGSDNEEEDSD
ncbi:hypothetical protein D9611_004914 [Ephemerocybe angulata]|uniref:Metaxin n=1 Tax=Ephemerocybe angulata TaxID=980116 RepID=A0A8H5EXI3_9AGAR|nr:hypothetical protein D9611_004914 [Tulosesus angulatus]